MGYERGCKGASNALVGGESALGGLGARRVGTRPRKPSTSVLLRRPGLSHKAGGRISCPPSPNPRPTGVAGGRGRKDRAVMGTLLLQLEWGLAAAQPL